MTPPAMVSPLPPSRLAESVAAKAPAQVIQKPPVTLSALSSMSGTKMPSSTGPGSDPTSSLTDHGKDNKPATGVNIIPEDKKAEQKKDAKKAKEGLKLAGVKQSPLRFLPFALIGIVVILIGVFVFRSFSGGSSNSVATTSSTGESAGKTGGSTAPSGSAAESVVLEYWGLWEPTEAMSGVLAKFEKANPGMSVRYTKQSYRDYRERLQTAVASGNGPDIFRFHASWTPMLSTELARMPSSVYSASEYQKTFYPVASRQLQIDGQLVGIPLMYDGLALYYNTEVFKTAAVDPPSTWSELRTLAAKLTIKSGGTIKRGGVALGNAVNVDHFSDIIGLLMLQNGADLADPNSNEARDALLFYTNFQKSDGVWNSTLPNSTIAFSRGEVAMFFAPSWRAHDIQAMNPDLKFATVPVPQLSDTRIAWATYWAEGVSGRSKKQDAAWKLLKFLSSAEVQQELAADQAQGRSFGELYSRTDLASKAVGNPIITPFLQDAPYAYGWYLSSSTHDNGINDDMIQYYQDAVTGMLGTSSVAESLKLIEQGTSQVLTQFGAN